MEKVLIGLIGVFSGFFLSFTKGLWLEWKSKRKNAEFLAIHVVCMLDRYVDGCVGVVNDDGLRYGQCNAEGYREIQTSLPTFELQNLGVDWKTISAELMYRILGFPNEIQSANNSIDSSFEHVASPPDYEEGFEDRQYQYTRLGLKAHR